MSVELKSHNIKCKLDLQCKQLPPLCVRLWPLPLCCLLSWNILACSQSPNRIAMAISWQQVRQPTKINGRSTNLRALFCFHFLTLLIKEKFRKSTGASASGKLQYSFVSLDLISFYSLWSNAELSFVLVLIHTLSLLCVQDNRTFPVRMFGDWIFIRVAILSTETGAIWMDERVKW